MTLFKDIKQNYPIHVLLNYEDGTLEYTQGKVVNVAPPYYPQSQQGGPFPNPPMPMTMGSQPSYNRVMDITVQIKERTTTYTVSENSSMAEAPGGVVLATNKDLIIGEVDTIRSNDQNELDKVSIRENRVLCADHIMEQLQPEVAERREFDKRLKSLESGYDTIKGNLDSILNILQKQNRS